MADEDEQVEDDKPRDDDREEGEEGGEAGEGGEGAEGAKAGGKKKLILIIAGAVILLLVGGGAGLYFTGMLDGLLGKDAAHEEAGEHGEQASADHGKKKKDSHGGGDGHGGGASAFLEIPTMIVNLNSSDGNARYLRLTVQLELEDPAELPLVEAVIPRVVDQFQTYLRELRVSDLRGSAGIYRLQMELLWRVNQAASPVKIKDVLFQEILIQ